MADRALLAMSDFVCGANDDGYHYTGANFGRDLPEPAEYVDIRNVVAGDPSPDGKGTLELCRGIEVGHIFQLRTKYSEAMSCTFLDESGTDPADGNGLLRHRRVAHRRRRDRAEQRRARHRLAAAMAPFQVAIAPIGWSKSAQVRNTGATPARRAHRSGLEVLLDDRDERPGVMFADLELIGIPHRITVGERSLKQGQVEYQGRSDTSARLVEVSAAADLIRSLCRS